MVVRRHNHPGWGWAGIAALVVAADLTGNQTMSEAFRLASRHPFVGPPVALGWVVLTAHLFGLIEPQYDPFHRLNCHRVCPHAARARLR